MGLLPFYHGFGFHMAVHVLVDLHRSVVLSKFKDTAFLGAIEKHKITTLWLVPPLILFLAKSPLVADYDLSAVQEVVCAGAPLGSDTETDVLSM